MDAGQAYGRPVGPTIDRDVGDGHEGDEKIGPAYDAACALRAGADRGHAMAETVAMHRVRVGCPPAAAAGHLGCRDRTALGLGGELSTASGGSEPVDECGAAAARYRDQERPGHVAQGRGEGNSGFDM